MTWYLGTEPPVPNKYTAADLGTGLSVVNNRMPESSVTPLKRKGKEEEGGGGKKSGRIVRG